jgi:hypothetical protein
MHSVLIADLAALASQHGPAIVRAHEEVPPEAVVQYWASSRSRMELWHQALTRYRAAQESGDSLAMQTWWHEHLVVMEEVLVTDMLTRVIAALALGLDESSDREDEVSPVTHCIHLSHLDASNRVHKMMICGRGGSVQDAVRLNRLRRGVERWTDALIGRMSFQSPSTIQYAFDLGRAQQFALETRAYPSGPARDTAAWLMNAAMHDTLRRRTSTQSALPEANRAVATSVLMMMRPEHFDSVGVLKSLWMNRLTAGTSRTDRIIDELMATDIDQAETATGLEMVNEPYFARWYL